MAKKGTLTVRVVSDTKAAEKGLDRFNTKVQSTGDKLEGAGKKMTMFATVPVAAAMGVATKAASELEQAIGGTEAVFGEARDTIDGFADTSARAMGLSEREFREATTSIGGQLKRMTGDVDFAAERSVELTGVAADLAATYGGTTSEAVQALGAAFRGEADPAERFNLNLKIGAANAKAVEMGLAASTSEVDENARAQATLALIMEQSADAQGQFAREADTAAGSMQIARAEMEDAAAELGSALAPIAAKAAGGIADLASAFGDLPDPVQNSVLAFAGVVAAAGPLLSVSGKIMNALPRMAGGFDTLRLRAMYMSDSMRGNIAVLGGLGAAFAAATVLTKKFEDRIESVDAVVGDLAGSATEDLVRAFEDLNAEMPSWVSQTERAEAQMTMFRQTAEENIGTAERLRDALVAEGHSAEDLDAILRDVASAQRRAADDTEASADAVDEYSGSADDATGPARKFTSELDKQEAAAARLDAAMQKLDEATERLIGSNLSAEKAGLRAEEAHAGLATTLKESGATLDIHSEKGRANRRAITDTADAALEHVEALKEQGASTDEVNFFLSTHVERLKETMRQAGLTEDEINSYIGTLGLTPKNIETVVALDGVAEAERQLNFLSRDRTTRVFATGIGETGAGRRAFHTGGVFRAPTPGGEGLALLRDEEEIRTPGQAKSDHARLAPTAAATYNITINNPTGRTAEDSIHTELRRVQLMAM